MIYALFTHIVHLITSLEMKIPLFPPKVSMASFFQYSFLDIGLLNAIPSSPAVLSMPAVLLFHHSS